MVFTMLQCLLYEGKISCRNKCASFLVVASRKLRANLNAETHTQHGCEFPELACLDSPPFHGFELPFLFHLLYYRDAL